MNRRSFLTRSAAAFVGAAALVHAPASLIARNDALASFVRDGIRERMRREYAAFCEKYPGRRPTRMALGGDAFRAYEGELMANERFVFVAAGSAPSEPELMFKGARVRRISDRGWQIGVMESA